MIQKLHNQIYNRCKVIKSYFKVQKSKLHQDTTCRVKSKVTQIHKRFRTYLQPLVDLGSSRVRKFWSAVIVSIWIWASATDLGSNPKSSAGPVCYRDLRKSLLAPLEQHGPFWRLSHNLWPVWSGLAVRP